MNKKINKKLLSGFNVGIGLLAFLLLLPLRNVYACTLCRFDPDYSPDYTYVYMITISIIIVYVIIMFVLSHIFIKSRILLLKALLLFLSFLFPFFWAISSFPLIDFKTIVNIIIVTVISYTILYVMIVWIFSYISIKNRILFLKLFITLFALLLVLSVASFYGDKKTLKDFNTFIECKKSGGVLREGVCGTGHKYCSFLTADYGKTCYDDNDCEGFCAIENIEEIKRIWDSNYPDNYVSKEYGHHLDHYLDIEKNDWINKTGIEIEGKCSKFKEEVRSISTCGDTFGEIWVEDGVIKRNEKCYSW